MNRMFYLAIVFDINGYDRINLVSSSSLEEIDSITEKYPDHDELKEKYLKDTNYPNNGRICLLFEDLDEKEKQLSHYNEAYDDDKERIKMNFSYVHMVPIKYQNTNLLEFASCYTKLKKKLHDFRIRLAILDNQKKDKENNKIIYLDPDDDMDKDVIKSNKRFIFNEQELALIKEGHYRNAMNLFIERLNTLPSDELYFIYRSLMNICKLCSNRIKTKYGTLEIYDTRADIGTSDIIKSKKIEEDSNNMEDFWTYHDLDEVIKYSPSNKPITSERRK